MIVRGHLATLEIFSIAKLNSFKRGYGPFASTTYGTKSAGSLIKLVLNVRIYHVGGQHIVLLVIP